MERAGEGGIAQSIPTASRNTWDFLVGQGYGKPETLVTIAPITGSGVAQAVARASNDGSTSGLAPGDFVFLEFGLSNEEHVNVISVDTVNQTFTAIVTKDHPAGSSIRPSTLGLQRTNRTFLDLCVTMVAGRHVLRVIPT